MSDKRPQQINLYNPALRRVRDRLSLPVVAGVAAAFAGLLIATGGAARWQAATDRDQARQLDADVMAARSRIAAIQSGAASGVRAEADRLQQQLEARRQVLTALQSGVGRGGVDESGFADYLRGLARQTVPGLWLTGFAVGPAGGNMEIRGRMTIPDALPAYLTRLGGERPFRGRQFATLSVNRGVATDSQGRAQGPVFSDFVLAAVPRAPGAGSKP